MGNSVSYSGDLSFDMKSLPTPFHQLTPGGLQYGKTVVIEGEVKIGQIGVRDRFNISFKCRGNDVAFQYDVRFWKDDKAIVMNTREKREWRREERLINTYQKDRLFRLQFELKESGIVIFQSNSSSPYTFPYRNELTPEKVKKITIKGNIQIKRLFYGYISNYNEQSGQSVARSLSERQPNPPYQHQQSRQDQQELPPYPLDACPNPTTTRPTSVFGTLPPVHLADHNSPPLSYAQPPFASSSDQPSISYQQQNHPAQPYSGQYNQVSMNRNNTLPSFHHSPSSPFNIPPPPYHAIQPSAPTVDDSHEENEEKFFDTREDDQTDSSVAMSSSAVTSTPTPPPRPIRRKMSEAMAISKASFRASIPPPRPSRPPRPPRPTAPARKIVPNN